MCAAPCDASCSAFKSPCGRAEAREYIGSFLNGHSGRPIKKDNVYDCKCNTNVYTCCENVYDGSKHSELINVVKICAFCIKFIE